MSEPNFVLLYVKDVPHSVQFYTGLLGKPAVESAPTFAMFALESGVMLGLWSQQHVEPTANLMGGGGELAFAVDSDARVDAMHLDWRKRDMTIAQAPVKLDFGYTFVALDPDKHRLRVFAAAAS